MQTNVDDLALVEKHLPKLNLCCIAWSRQQYALTSMWPHRKQNSCFKQIQANSTLNGEPLKLTDLFTYLGSNIFTTEMDVNWKGMDYYWQVVDQMKIWFLWKKDILPGINHISTTVWLHFMDFIEMLGEKAIWELHKDAACCSEQILEALNA